MLCAGYLIILVLLKRFVSRWNFLVSSMAVLFVGNKYIVLKKEMWLVKLLLFTLVLRAASL